MSFLTMLGSSGSTPDIGSGAGLLKRWTSTGTGTSQIRGTGNANTKIWTSSGSGTVTFTPLAFGSGLIVWLRGDSIHDDGGGKVDLWTDKGPAGNNLAQATSGSRPTINANALGGKAGATFVATHKLGGTLAAAVTAHTIWFVVKWSNHSGWQTPLGLGNFVPEYGTFNSDPASFQAASKISAGLSNNTNTYYLMCYVRDTNGFSFFQDSATGSTNPISGPALAAFSTTITVGAGSPASGDPFSGEIAEMIIINTAASSTDRDNIKAYVNTYYGTSF